MQWNLDVIIVVSYLIFTLAVGLYYGRGVRNIKEYAVGNRNFSTTVLVMTITATMISGGFVMLGAGEAARIGIIDTLSTLGMALSALLNAYLIGPRMGRFLGKISVGEIMGDLYGKIGQVITGISSFIVCLGFVSAQVKVMGTFFNYFAGIDALSAVIISSLIIVLYSAFGGIRAVTFTDVLQFGTFMVSIPLIYSIIINIVGGYKGIAGKVEDYHLNIFNEKVNLTTYGFMFLFFAIPYLNPSTGQRMLMARDTRQIIDSFKYSAGVLALLAVLCGVIGILAYAIDPTIEPATAFLVIVDKYLPSGAKGVAIIGMIAVIMSTADSFMNAGSVALTHDVIKPIFKSALSERRELILSKIITVILGVSSIFLALKFTSLLELGLFMQSFYGPLVGIPLMLGIFGFQSTKRVFITSLLISIALIIAWWAFNMEGKLGFGPHVPTMITNALILLLMHKILGEKGGWGHGVGNGFSAFSKFSKAYKKLKLEIKATKSKSNV